MNTTKPKSRKVAWVVLGVVVIAVVILTARPSLWDWVQYRTVERVYWPDGTIRFEYKLPRWGGGHTTLYEKDSTGEESTRSRAHKYTLTCQGADGVLEWIVFPGSAGGPFALIEIPEEEVIIIDESTGSWSLLGSSVELETQ